MSGTQNPNTESPSAEGADAVDDLNFSGILAFDPFGPASDTGSGADGGQAQEDDQGALGADDQKPTLEGEVGKGKPPAQAASPDPAARKPENAPSGGDDKDQTIESLRAQIGKLLASPAPVQEQTQTPAVAAKPSDEPQDDPNPYKMLVSKDLVSAMMSEEPEQQRAAVSALANSVMNKMFQDFRGALVDMERRIVSQIPNIMNTVQTTKTAQQQIEEDFYGAFPELNKPILRDAVWNTVGSIAKRTGAQGWTPELRDTAGQFLLDNLGFQRAQAQGNGQQQTAVQAPAAGKPAPRRTFAAGSGGGGSNRPNGQTQANEFADVLDIN